MNNPVNVVALRILKLMKFMLDQQGTSKTRDVSEDDIFEAIYSDFSKENKLKKFKIDCNTIDELFRRENNDGGSSHETFFKRTQMAKRGKNGVKGACARWRYAGTWAFLDLNESKEALVMLVGLQLARSFLYASDGAADSLRSRILAAMPQSVHDDAQALMEGMKLEQAVIGITGNDRTNARHDGNLNILLEAVRAEGLDRYVNLDYSDDPYIPFKGVFLPCKVFFANHDWYAFGLCLNNPQAPGPDNTDIQIVRLSRIRRVEACASGRLGPCAGLFGLSASQLEKVQNAVFQGMFKFPMKQVMNDDFPSKAEIQLKFFDGFADSAYRARLLFGEKDKEWLMPEEIDGKERNKVLNYLADVAVLDEKGNPDPECDFPLKMALFKAIDQVVVCGPRALQEQAIAMAESFINRTRAEMERQDAALKGAKKKTMRKTTAKKAK